jgi:hypothetical protein
MVLSNIEPELKHIIGTLRSGNLDHARSRTVELIESVLLMSNPMYREDKNPSGGRGGQTYNRAPGTLRALTEHLREVSFTIRCGTPADALLIAERALALFLKPAVLVRT